MNEGDHTMSFRMFTCAACGKIVRGRHAQAVTCSVACRVRLHRHPGVREQLDTECRGAGLTLPQLLERRALAIEHPDLAERIAAGDLVLEDARTKVYKRYMVARFKLARSRHADVAKVAPPPPP